MNLSRERGQALVEYLMLILFIAGAAGIFGRYMPRILNRIERPIKHDFRMVYRYGARDACGFDESDGAPCAGVPMNHPRYDSTAFPGNFKIFSRDE